MSARADRHKTQDEAIEAVHVAEALLEQYRRDAARLGQASGEDKLLALDQNYAGIWEKLEHARDLLAALELDVSTFDVIQHTARETRLGYDEERKIKVGPTIGLGGVGVEIKEQITRTIDPQLIRTVTKAITALKNQLPETAWVMSKDPEVELFIKQQRSAGWVWRLLLWCAIVIVGSAAVFLIYRWVTPPEYGAHTRTIITLERGLQKVPCDQQLSIKLAEAYLEAGLDQRSIEFAKECQQQCGDNRRLRWTLFTAYKRTGQLPLAITEASALITAVPHDWDYRWWRGEVWQQLGQTEKAIIDYQQAIALNPALTYVPPLLGQALVQVHRSCEAIFWLDNYLYHHPEASSSHQAQLAQLRRLPECRKSTGTGRAEFRLDATTCQTVTIGGEEVTAQGCFFLMVESPFVILSARLAAATGLRGAPEEWLVRLPDGALAKATAASARRLTIQQATITDVPVMIVAQLPQEAEGYLGRSFLSRFVNTVAEDENTLEIFPHFLDE